jgi:hypothetical protein
MDFLKKELKTIFGFIDLPQNGDVATLFDFPRASYGA